MNKELITRLVKYAEDIKGKLLSGVPAKHLANPETYRRYLENELRLVTSNIDKEKTK